LNASRGEPASKKLFVALWPDERVRASLVELQNRYALHRYGRCTAGEKLHITLHFIGQTPAHQVEALCESISLLKFEPFAFELDTIGFFPSSRVLWTGCAMPQGKLTGLVMQVTSAMSIPMPVDRLRSFMPHATLARKASRRMRESIEPIVWQVERCRLIESVQSGGGVKYCAIAESAA